MGKRPDAALRDGIAAALRAVQLDERNPYSHYAVAITHLLAGQFEPAIRAAQRTLALNPTYALGHLVLGAAISTPDAPRRQLSPLSMA